MVEVEIETRSSSIPAAIPGLKLGELSRALDTSKGGSNPKATLPAAGKSKAQALKAAGISTSAANRYEQFNRRRSRTLEANHHRAPLALAQPNTLRKERKLLRAAQAQTFRGERRKPLAIAFRGQVVDGDVLPVRIAKIAQAPAQAAMAATRSIPIIMIALSA